MKDKTYLLIDADILPDVFTKVIMAKDLLLSGVAKNTSDASRIVGISRSAFYKYRDSVFKYKGNTFSKIYSFHIILHDKHGMLSKILTEFSRFGADILTVNQDIPSGGLASVSLSIQTDTLSIAIEELLQKVTLLDGVVSARILHSN